MLLPEENNEAIVGGDRVDSPESISHEYYEFASNFVQTDFEDDKLLGKFYTDHGVCSNMVQVVSSAFVQDPFLHDIRIIDPFCGDGRLIVELLSAFIQSGSCEGKRLYISIWDIDPAAVQKAQKEIYEYCEGQRLSFEIDARVSDAFVDYRSVVGTYDICITNPPWGLLKPHKLFSKSNSEEVLETYRRAIERYDQYMKAAFPLSQPSSKFGKWGTNLARCGTEVAIRLIKRSGVCAIVSPASFLNDQVSEKLRKWVFENFKVVNVSYYPAELKLFGTADISSVTMVIKGGETDQSLTVCIYSSRIEYKSTKIEKAVFEYIKGKGFSIPLKTGIEAIPIMMYLETLPTTLEYCQTTGLVITREMDETRVSEKLLNSGRIEFAKGYMVDRYSFHGGGLFLNEEKVIPPSSVDDYKLIWRDVSRDSQIRRIKATILPPGYICGNSLGVIHGDIKSLDYLKTLLVLVNSMIYEYQARSMLVSNHVAAGIIKQIHLPIPAIEESVTVLVDRALGGEDVELQLELVAARLYGLSFDNYKTIVDSFSIPEESKNLLLAQYSEILAQTENGDSERMIYNHYASNLSDLDMQIIRCVPPGGNWKNIPESVPSHRLEQIRESYREGKGSRSTYYGRLRPEMPAYTINTYFNRPGNGCHIHYDQDRTISQREAARFQTFPDSFEFKGSLGAINTQIGNAVPPLLAFQIARSIPFIGQFVDLFCGAGGLALGFTWAGWTPIIGNDIDGYAIETHKRNLDGDAIVGDINAPEVHDTIIEKAKEAREQRPDLPLFVLGGPPCQGFSTANTRRGAEDMRNWLFRSYISIVKAIQPDGFVFENVRGILNLDKGKFFEMIKSELMESVETIKVNQVSAAHFGVPQRRDRVIIIGGPEKLVHSFSMKEITCVPKNGQISLLPPVIGVEDAIGDLPPLIPGEDGSMFDYRFPAANPYQKFMRGEISPEEYLMSISE